MDILTALVTIVQHGIDSSTITDICSVPYGFVIKHQNGAWSQYSTEELESMREDQSNDWEEAMTKGMLSDYQD